jgi:hypothetical protein
MSTDRALLEKAAKAAGYNVDWLDENANAGRQSGGFYFGVGSYTPCRWNPLTDDGDAIRLAVAMELSVNAYSSYVIVADQHADFEGRDRMAVMRRAIVRAAAAIGDKP